MVQVIGMSEMEENKMTTVWSQTKTFRRMNKYKKATMPEQHNATAHQSQSEAAISNDICLNRTQLPHSS